MLLVLNHVRSLELIDTDTRGGVAYPSCWHEDLDEDDLKKSLHWVCHGTNDDTGETYSAVLEDDYVQVDSKIKGENIDLCMQQKKKFSHK